MPVFNIGLICIIIGMLLLAADLRWRVRRRIAINHHQPLVGRHARHERARRVGRKGPRHLRPARQEPLWKQTPGKHAAELVAS